MHICPTQYTISTQCISIQRNIHHFNTVHIYTTQSTLFQHSAHLYNIIHSITTHRFTTKCTTLQHTAYHHNPGQTFTIRTITTQQIAQHYSTVHTNTTQHKRTECAKLIDWQGQRKQKALHESTDLAVPSVGQRAVVGEEETSVSELLPCGVAHCIMVVRVAQPFLWNWDTNSPLCIK